MDSVKFTVHVPVYNVEKYLERCINSILEQTYGNFEIILTDDGSTDSSGEICDIYAKKYDNIRVYHNKNQGLLLTRRFSIKKSQGEFSVFVDSDDYIEKNTLEKIANIIETHECDIVAFNYRRVSEKKILNVTSVWNEFKVFENDIKLVFYNEFLFSTKLNNLCMKAIKTSLLLSDNTDYDKLSHVTNGEDFIQSLYVVFNSKKIVYTPEVFYNYWTNTESMTRTVDLKKYKSLSITRYSGLKYLKAFGLDGSENLKKYALVSVNNLIEYIKTVCLAECSENDKVKVFKGIVEEEYYKNFVFYNTDESEINLFNRKIYKCLKRGYYDKIIKYVMIYTKIRGLLGSIKRKIKI